MFPPLVIMPFICFQINTRGKEGQVYILYRRCIVQSLIELMGHAGFFSDIFYVDFGAEIHEFQTKTHQDASPSSINCIVSVFVDNYLILRKQHMKPGRKTELLDSYDFRYRCVHWTGCLCSSLFSALFFFVGVERVRTKDDERSGCERKKARPRGRVEGFALKKKSGGSEQSSGLHYVSDAGYGTVTSTMSSLV